MRNGSWIADAKAIVKAVLPARVLSLIRAWRSLEPRERSVYWRQQLLRSPGPQRRGPAGRPAAVHSVLFVCRGNLIRSPMAAALLRRYLSDVHLQVISIASAGLHANPGQGADARALTVARQFGVSLEDHRARRLTRELVLVADAIFAMDSLNEAELLGRYPEARRKVFMLGALAAGGRRRPLDIVDPYDGDETEIRRCYESLHSCIRGLAAAFFQQPEPVGADFEGLARAADARSSRPSGRGAPS